MKSLFQSPNPLHEIYGEIYDALSELRESFHRSGRLDDSNAKLDEVSKLFATYLAFKNGQIDKFPNEGSLTIVAELQSAFASTVRLPQYRLNGGESIFGSQPTLSIRPGDEGLATDLVRLVRNCIDLAFDLRTAGRPFDILNEAFGHFIRDNFRSNIEDAQYMTPPEIVNFMTDFVLHDITKRGAAAQRTDKHWTVLDPSCGVGSFLAAVYHRARDTNWLDPKRLRLFGQDKVERMVRLSSINLELFDVEEHRITLGNSLERGSPIDILNGEVDVILTNPPFGARFNHNYVSRACGDNTPFFSKLKRTAAMINSELLFIDRNIRFLREGGRLLIVVPDGVVSAKGMAAMLRQYIGRVATVRAVIELPTVAFAQAGTRTKTTILYLQKGRDARPSNVFMGISENLGFQVSSRKGIQIKVAEGIDDLPKIMDCYRHRIVECNTLATSVLCMDPSCVAVQESAVLKASWTPKHYSAARFQTLETIRKIPDIDLVPLGNLVEFCADTRKVEVWHSGWAFVSVLHILGEGFVDIGGALSYSPKTPGIPTKSGELLISRINPRIPRVCVLPDFGVKTLCSSEFEVMKSKAHTDVYTLAYILQTEAVQNQIRSLTSGTSASHNRIRTSDLAQILIPIPRRGTKKAKAMDKLVKEYSLALDAIHNSTAILAKIRTQEVDLFAR